MSDGRLLKPVDSMVAGSTPLFGISESRVASARSMSSWMDVIQWKLIRMCGFWWDRILGHHATMPSMIARLDANGSTTWPFVVYRRRRDDAATVITAIETNLDLGRFNIVLAVDSISRIRATTAEWAILPPWHDIC